MRYRLRNAAFYGIDYWFYFFLTCLSPEFTFSLFCFFAEEEGVNITLSYSVFNCGLYPVNRTEYIQKHRHRRSPHNIQDFIPNLGEYLTFKPSLRETESPPPRTHSHKGGEGGVRGEKLFSSSLWLSLSFFTSFHVVSSRCEAEKEALCLQSVALCVGEALRGWCSLSCAPSTPLLQIPLHFSHSVYWACTGVCTAQRHRSISHTIWWPVTQ